MPPLTLTLRPLLVGLLGPAANAYMGPLYFLPSSIRPLVVNSSSSVVDVSPRSSMLSTLWRLSRG